MILGTPPVWTPANALLLQQFLQGGTGQLFLATLAAQRPPLSNVDALETVALRAKCVEGYEAAINTIISLAVPEKEEDAVAEIEEPYPDLDDDKKWTTATPETE